MFKPRGIPLRTSSLLYVSSDKPSTELCWTPSHLSHWDKSESSSSVHLASEAARRVAVLMMQMVRVAKLVFLVVSSQLGDRRIGVFRSLSAVANRFFFLCLVLEILVDSPDEYRGRNNKQDYMKQTNYRVAQEQFSNGKNQGDHGGHS